MAKFDTAFSPSVTYGLLQKETPNELQVASAGILNYLDRRDKKKVNDMKIEDLEATRRDEKKLVQFGTADTTLGAFARENGNFETADGIAAAHKIRMERAKQRLNEFKATHPKGSGKTDQPSSTTTADPAVFEKMKSLGSPVNKGRTVVRTGMKNGRKAVMYSDGSVEYGD